MTNPSFTSTVFTPDRLLAGDFPTVTESITLAIAQVLARGALLGRVTATGEYLLSLAAAVDGSQVPVAVLADDADTTLGAATGAAYLSGEFNDNAITFGTGHTAASVKDGLRDLNIYLKTPVVA